VVIQIFFKASAEVGQILGSLMRGDFGIIQQGMNKFDFTIRKELAFARGNELTFENVGYSIFYFTIIFFR
jgi:hypothetical protein